MDKSYGVTPTQRLILSLAGMLAVCAALAYAGDWPMERHDARRSGVTEESLSFPLHPVWVQRGAQPPQPAWPPPVKTLNRLDFDYAPVPVMAGGLVCFGSSADDTLRALDAATGVTKWQFTADGPIRFAPQIVGGRVYCAADNGYVYCLDAATGRMLWSFRGGLDASRLIGNGRLISRWPARSGVLVQDGMLYCAFGMWPAEGVLVYALNPETGKVVWCNDTSGAMYMTSAHGGEYTLSGVAPQGALLAEGDILLVPTGRCFPAAYDRKTGAFRYHDIGDHNGQGGTWVAIDGDKIYTFSKGFYSPLFIGIYDLATGKWRARAGNIPQISTFGKGRRQSYSVYEDARVSAVVSGGKVLARKAFALILAGSALLVGEEGAVSAQETESGRELWRAPVNGRPYALAVAGGRLIVSTDRGEVSCFRAEASGGAPRVYEPPTKLPAAPPPATGSAAANVLAALRQADVDQGYALVVGDADGALSETLAAHTRLRIVALTADPETAQRLRARLLAETAWYGSRIHVLPLETNAPPPFAPYFANAIIVAGALPGVSGSDLYRMLRPCGGVLLAPGLDAAAAEALSAATGAPANERRAAADGPLLVRGPLPDAWDWDSEYAMERRVKWPLRLLWFGGPGAAKVMDRKEGGRVVAAAGRYFVKGESEGRGLVTAVDAYNGCELWTFTLSNTAFTIASADASAVYLGLGSNADVTLDALTGVEKKGDADRSASERRKPVPTGVAAAHTPRLHPLTGQPGDKTYFGTFGCSILAFSENEIYMRSGTLGIYDFLDDSGLRNFGGVTPSCGQSVIAALGLVISSEGRGGCDCSYNYQTSLALAPAERRLHEDWALFYDRTADAPIREAHLNFGAPGDRRDDQGALWLGNFPRPSFTGHGLARAPASPVPDEVRYAYYPLALQVPLTVEGYDGFAPYRVNADRIRIAGTDRPWIYASGYRGLKKAVFKLNPTPVLTALARGGPIAVDGRLDEPDWSGAPQAVLPLTKTDLWLRYDAEALYLATRRSTAYNPQGQPTQWVVKNRPRDGEIWSEHSIELFLGDEVSSQRIHLGVSAAGVQYDALIASEKGNETRWNGVWQSAVTTGTNGFVAEVVVPWKLLTDAGLDARRPLFNLLSNNRHNSGDAVVYLGQRGRVQGAYGVPLGLGTPRRPEPRAFTVRLHFAELEDIAPGRRVFNVRLQDAVVLKDFDIVKEAGGPRRALVKEFPHVQADDALTVELIAAERAPASDSAPILSGLELVDESAPAPAPPSAPAAGRKKNK